MLAEGSIQQRGSAKLGCLIAAGVGLLVVLILALTFAGRYNSLVTLQESTEAAWSEIDNQYKRRYDLIPQLVSTVKGAADFEKSTLESVTEARASVGRAQLQQACRTTPHSCSPTSRRNKAWGPLWAECSPWSRATPS